MIIFDLRNDFEHLLWRIPKRGGKERRAGVVRFLPDEFSFFILRGLDIEEKASISIPPK